MMLHLYARVHLRTSPLNGALIDITEATVYGYKAKLLTPVTPPAQHYVVGNSLSFRFPESFEVLLDMFGDPT